MDAPSAHTRSDKIIIIIRTSNNSNILIKNYNIIHTPFSRITRYEMIQILPHNTDYVNCIHTVGNGNYIISYIMPIGSYIIFFIFIT
jgi:hypothetical protein